MRVPRYKIQIKDSEEAATGDNVSIIVNTDVDSAIENIDTFENSTEASTTFQARSSGVIAKLIKPAAQEKI